MKKRKLSQLRRCLALATGAALVLPATVLGVSTAANAVPGGYTANQADTSMLAHYMDRPLYDAIVTKYLDAAGNNSSKIKDVDADGAISLTEAASYAGNVTLNQQALSGTIRGIEKFTKAQRVYLQENQFTGSIPDLSGMSELLVLNLSYNWLTGSVPASLGSLGKLNTLLLTSNYLSGSIPAELQNLGNAGTGFTDLRLALNELTGPIPAEIGSLSELTSLDLSNNFLSGELPSTMSQLTKMKTLTLSDNLLTGSIPDGIAADMQDLVSFNVGLNKFSGSIPSSLGGADKTALTTIALSYNNFSGAMPATFDAIPGLTVLQLGYNPNLVAAKPSSMTAPNYSAYRTAGMDPQLNTPSNVKNIKGEFIVLNQDVDGDGLADINFANFNNTSQQWYPYTRVDVTGDKKADLNILLGETVGANSNFFNRVAAVFDANGVLLGWRNYEAPGTKVLTPITAADVTMYGAAYPHYIESSKIVPDTDQVQVEDPASPGSYVTIERAHTKAGVLPPRPLVLNQPDGNGGYLNIDVNGDGVPDLNVTGGTIAPVNVNDTYGFPESQPLSSEVSAPTQSSDSTAPNYLKPNLAPEDLIVVNLDLNSDGIPDRNVTIKGGSTPYFSLLQPDGSVKNPVQNTDPAGLNYDADGDGHPDFNLDLDADGFADVNIDTNGDGVIDLNEDANGDGIPDLNIVTGTDGKLASPVNPTDKPNVNIDADHNGIPDLNVVTNPDGMLQNPVVFPVKPNINVDSNADGIADINVVLDPATGKVQNPLLFPAFATLNVDTNGDGKPDVNVDTNGDGKADLNIDTNKDGKPDLNVVTNPDGSLKNPVTPTDKPNINVDANHDGKLDKGDLNLVLNPDGSFQLPLKFPVKANANIDANGDGVIDGQLKACSVPRTSAVFRDVAVGQKFFKEIDWMQCKGLSTGTKQASGKPVYAPKDSLTREAMAAFIYRLEAPKGYTAPEVSPFADVKPGDKFYKEITWMYSAGLSTGTKQASGKPVYAPKSSLSREAMAAFIYRLEAKTDAKVKSYTAPKSSPLVDMKSGAKFYKEINWMYSAKLTTGVKTPAGKEYQPKASLTREAMAAFIYRLEH